MLRNTRGLPTRILLLRRPWPQTGPNPCLYKRTFVSGALQSCADGLIDLALALPYPSSVPPYSSTIILVTVLGRLFFTLPVSIWAKQRTLAIEGVQHELKQLRPQVTDEAARSLQREGARGTREQLTDELRKRTAELLKAKHQELLADKKVSLPLLMLLPSLTQLPVFVLTTMVIQRASLLPTPFESESFLSLTSLTHSDPTLALPIALGILTLANVESSSWWMSAAQQATHEARDRQRREQLAKGEKVKLEIRKVVKPVLRVVSVVRIMIGALVPGSVVISWVTSAAFGLFQTWAFDWWGQRTRRLQSVLLAPPNAAQEPAKERRKVMPPNHHPAEWRKKRR